MDFLHENARIGSLVAKVPEYASLFEKLGLDYCCKGKKTLKELCAEKNLDVVEVLDKLKKTPAIAGVMDWNQVSTKELIEHIVKVHHAFLRDELPRLSQLINKVATKHGHRNSHLAELQVIFEKFRASLEKHIDEEEKVVFPAIENFSTNLSSITADVKNHLISLESEHLEAGTALERINELTNGYIPPADACITHLVMLNSLACLEKDMHEHVHKENHILFGRIIKQD